MRFGPAAVSLLLGLAIFSSSLTTPTGPAAAQSQDEEPSPGELAGEAMQKLMQALELLIGSIPQYEAPYIDENGDIIIRRKRNGELPIPKEKPTPPDVDTTTT